MLPIVDIAKKLKLTPEQIVRYGDDKAKIRLEAIGPERPGKLVLVTAMSPSPAGEGKTTTVVGVVDALNRIGRNAVAALREPSMGPVFGMKGGGAGGGKAELSPADEINLHFTGDFHAVSSAHNLLAATLDNHLHFGNSLGIDTRQVFWERVMDCNDRSLRQIVVGLGGKLGGVPRESRFDITAASEITAIMALSTGIEDLRQRLGRLVLARTYDGKEIKAKDLKAEGSLVVLLKQALLPNLAQTMEGNPAIIHSGPFANIAHGTNSVLGTWAGLNRADMVIQEAGFGADLGAEKFLNIFCPAANVVPSVVVLVCTIRAMRFHGGVPKQKIAEPNLAAVEKGLANPMSHFKNMQNFGLPVVVALNQRADDSPEEVKFVLQKFAEAGITAVGHTCFADGGAGGEDLARAIADVTDRSNGRKLKPTYLPEDPLAEKISKIASQVYGARGVLYEPKAARQLKTLEENGYRDSRICMAKTQYSFSDQADLVGRPTDFDIKIREVRLAAGAGFVIPISGEVMTMPGLAKEPNLEKIDLDPKGQPILF
jgi:formate--tetrahydrofolate ligase